MNGQPAIYSIEEHETEKLIQSFWDDNDGVFISRTMDRDSAARWCADHINEVYDSLPDKVQAACKVVANKPPQNTGWVYCCHKCESEMFV